MGMVYSQLPYIFLIITLYDRNAFNSYLHTIFQLLSFSKSDYLIFTEIKLEIEKK